MDYLKVWTSFREVIAPLNDSEKGRLFDAMLHYAETGEEPPEFKGNERFLWPVAKLDIDRTAQKCETLKANASKGGLAKSRNQQMLANDSKVYQTVANDSKDNQTEANPALNNNIKIKKNNNKEKDLMFDQFWAAYPRKEAKPKAYAAFQKINPDEELLEKMLSAIERWKASDQWNEDNGRYIPHPTTWLNQQRWNDDPPKKKNGSVVKQVVVAQQYQQRDYSGQQENFDDRMDRLEEMMNVS